MSERTLRQLVGSLFVLVVLWGVIAVIDRGSGSIEAGGDVARAFDQLSAETLERVRFGDGADAVELVRSNGGWTANGFPADQAAVDRFTADLADLRVGDLTATNPANHDRMGVSEDSAVVVTLLAAGRERTVLLGHAGRRFGTSYIRLPTQDEVYLLDGDLRAAATRSLGDWRDRSMLSVDTAAVTTIEVSGTDRGYTLTRADSSWTLADGSTAEPSAVQGILSELSSLSATGFLSDGDSLAVLPEAARTTVRSNSGDVLAEVRLGEGESQRWARSSARDFLYRLSAFRAGRVAPTLAEVRPQG